MKLNLVWHVSERWDDVRPDCFFSEFPEGFKQCLASLLDDDGGSPNFSYVDWVSTGLAKIDDVKNHIVQSEDWSSNSWGALISRDQVEIEFLYDESYFDLMSIEVVEKILLAWKDFVQSEPLLGKRVTIEL